MNRRKFFKVSSMSALGVAMAATISDTACWFTGTIFTQIMAYVGVGLTAFQAVVDLLDPAVAPAVDAAIKLVKAGFADLQLAVQAYNNAPAADKTTLLQKVATVLALLQNQIQTFWSNLNLPSGTLATLIQGLLGIILSTLAGFAGQLPAPVSAQFKVPARTLPVTPQRRNKKQFETDFNKVMTQAGKPAVKF